MMKKMFSALVCTLALSATFPASADMYTDATCRVANEVYTNVIARWPSNRDGAHSAMRDAAARLTFEVDNPFEQHAQAVLLPLFMEGLTDIARDNGENFKMEDIKYGLVDNCSNIVF